MGASGLIKLDNKYFLGCLDFGDGVYCLLDEEQGVSMLTRDFLQVLSYWLFLCEISNSPEIIKARSVSKQIATIFKWGVDSCGYQK